MGNALADGRIDKSLRRENYNVEDAVVRYEDKRLRACAEWQASDWLTLRDEALHLAANRHWKDVEQYSFVRRRAPSIARITSKSCTTCSRPATGWKPPSRRAGTGWWRAGTSPGALSPRQ